MFRVKVMYILKNGSIPIKQLTFFLMSQTKLRQFKMILSSAFKNRVWPILWYFVPKLKTASFENFLVTKKDHFNANFR